MKITGHSKYETLSKYYRMHEADVHKDYFDLWDNIQITNKPEEIIKRLISKDVSFETISFVLGIEIEKIKDIAK